MNYTNETILISCAECSPDVYVEGLSKMISHIIDFHKEYSLEEAEIYAKIWLENAYEVQAQRNADAAKDSAYERTEDHLRGIE